jgi:hypothetical protein
MHAVVAHVTIKPGRLEEAEKELKAIVVPMVSSAKGFVSGVWVLDEPTSKGTSIATFDSEADARAFVAKMESAPPPGDNAVTLDGIEVCAVVATA